MQPQRNASRKFEGWPSAKIGPQEITVVRIRLVAIGMYERLYSKVKAYM